MEKRDNREALDVGGPGRETSFWPAGRRFSGWRRPWPGLQKRTGLHPVTRLCSAAAYFSLPEANRKRILPECGIFPCARPDWTGWRRSIRLSREIVAGKHTPGEARDRLLEIQKMPPKARIHQVLASGVGSACFCFLFGGDWLDSLAALGAGLLLYLYLLYLVKGRTVQDRLQHLGRGAGKRWRALCCTSGE